MLKYQTGQPPGHSISGGAGHMLGAFGQMGWMVVFKCLIPFANWGV